MAGDVAQRLAHHGDDVLTERAGDEEIDGTGERDAGSAAKTRGELAHHVEETMTDRLGVRGLKSEDGRAEVGDGRVDLSGVRGDGFGTIRRGRCQRLQAEPCSNNRCMTLS